MADKISIPLERLQNRSTWVRFAALLACYLAVPAVVQVIADAAADSGHSVFLVLLLLLPIITVVLAAWDGIVEGFTALWLVLPFLLFLVPMVVFFNSSALSYGVVYSVLAVLSSAIGGAVFRAKQRLKTGSQLTPLPPAR